MQTPDFKNSYRNKKNVQVRIVIVAITLAIIFHFSLLLFFNDLSIDFITRKPFIEFRSSSLTTDSSKSRSEEAARQRQIAEALDQLRPEKKAEPDNEVIEHLPSSFLLTPSVTLKLKHLL